MNNTKFTQRVIDWRFRDLTEQSGQPQDLIWLNSQHRASVRPRTGMVFYADGSDYDPGNGEGVYVYDGSTHQQVVGYDLWDDLRFPATQIRRDALDKPDFDYTNIGLLFPQNDATETVSIVAQMPHRYKRGSDIYPHVHWVQTGASFPTWTMEYKWFNTGDAVPGSFTTLTTSTGVISYVGGSLSQLSSFSAITGTGKKESSVLLIKFYRNDNVVSGDVTMLEFDIHYQADKGGTASEIPA